jgi:hypothetical protein
MCLYIHYNNVDTDLYIEYDLQVHVCVSEF